MEQAYEQPRETISDEQAAYKKKLFDQYVTPYLRMVYKLCIQYSFNPHNVRDNYVEVLSNLYKYIESYDPQRSIHTWLHIVTKRCVYDTEQRRKRSHKISDDGDIETYSDSEMYAEEETSFNVMGVENYRELYSDDVLWALDQLKPQYRRALIYQTAGYKLKEIAEFEHNNGALDSKNIDTVKSRLFLARKQLRELLTRDGKRRTEEDQDYKDDIYEDCEDFD